MELGPPLTVVGYGPDEFEMIFLRYKTMLFISGKGEKTSLSPAKDNPKPVVNIEGKGDLYC